MITFGNGSGDVPLTLLSNVESSNFKTIVTWNIQCMVHVLGQWLYAFIQPQWMEMWCYLPLGIYGKDTSSVVTKLSFLFLLGTAADHRTCKLIELEINQIGYTKRVDIQSRQAGFAILEHVINSFHAADKEIMSQRWK